MWHWQLRNVLREYQLQIILIGISCIIHSVLCIIFFLLMHDNGLSAQQVTLRFNRASHAVTLVHSTAATQSSHKQRGVGAVSQGAPGVLSVPVKVPRASTVLTQQPVQKKEKKIRKSKKDKGRGEKAKQVKQKELQKVKPVQVPKPKKPVVAPNTLIPTIVSPSTIPVIDRACHASNTISREPTPQTPVVPESHDAVIHDVPMIDFLAEGMSHIEDASLFTPLQQCVYEQWKVPHGLSKSLKATVQVVINEVGKVQWKVTEPSGNFLYDIAIRTALAKIPADVWPKNKTIFLTFG